MTSSLILPGVIGLVTLYIAYQQWRTNKNQLRLNLFDRRYAVFIAVMKLVEVIAKTGEVSGDQLREFLLATKGALFLFDQKTQDYCDQLSKHAIAIKVDEVMLSTTVVPSDLREKVDARSLERLNWFNDEANKIQKRFRPFLGIVG